MIDTIKLDDREFRKAMAVYAAGSKRSTAELLRQQAKLFLQDTVNVTPPAGKGARGSAAKQRGMKCVEKDILKLMHPYDPPAQANMLRAAGMFVEEASQKSPADIHKANRSKKDGRVKRRIFPRIKIRSADLKHYIAEKQKMVGVLASGWNAAGDRLGWRLPGWIARHGAGSGQCRVEVGGPDMKIVITNSVSFVNRADDLERRVAFALYKRTRAILRQLEHFQQQAARRAGL